MSETEKYEEARRLTLAISRGDPEAFALFYEQWFDRCYGLARKLTRRDESFCLDVVQDAMLRVTRSLPAIRTEDHLSRWMWRLVHYTSLDHLRRQARRDARERKAFQDRESSSEPLPEADSMERILWLEKALAELPAAEALLLRNRFVEEKTFAESGAALGITANAAIGRIQRSLLRLRSSARRLFHE